MKQYLPIILLFCLLGKINGQQSTTVIPPSPDAAALAIYGNVPVSTYTGVPNINLPLYTINYRDVQIPVDLSYHSGGITVEQDASWVGLGWSLNVGGIITRTIKGGDDLQFSNDGYSNLGGFDYQGYPYDAFDNTPDFLKNVCNKQLDPEPDIFYFNFLGKSGRFVLEKGQNKSSTVLVGTPLKVEKIDIKYDKPSTSWIIRTPDGYAYYFNTIELIETLHGEGVYGKGPERAYFDPSSHGFHSWDDIMVSSWYLDKVVTPLGEEINYLYDVEDITGVPGTKNSRYGSARISITDMNMTQVDPTFVPGSTCYYPPLQTPVTKTYTNHIYLKEIQHSLGKIIFNKSLRTDLIPPFLALGNESYLYTTPSYMTWINDQQGPQKLDNIIFQNKNDQIIKKIEFVYTYFNPLITGNDQYSFKRLKLDKVRETDGMLSNPYHQFFYDETTPLPSKYSNAQDFWGYYNGAIDNPSRIPYGTFLNPTDNKHYFLGDANRQPNEIYMKSGTLNKIVYPTGGSTQFEFEPHDYFVFGNDAFRLTDFENNEPIAITGLVTAENDANAYKTVSFTVTEPFQEISVNSAMTYYASATSSDPCNVTDPGTTYAGNEVWYTIQETSASSFTSDHRMSDFLTFFTTNYHDHCTTTPYTPESIEPIYHKKESLVLPAGTYELKVYRRQGFNIAIDIQKIVIKPRTISQNGQGVLAKTAGGLRIKRTISKESEVAAPVIKKYDYTFTLSNNPSRTSSGKLMLYPDYHAYFYCAGDDPTLLVGITGSSWTITPIGTSASGCTVGYDKVIESEGNNYENGWTEYYFNNQEEEYVPDPTLFIPGLPTIKRTFNGQLIETKRFSKDDGLLTTESYEYSLPQFPKQIKGIATRRLLTTTPGPFPHQLNTACYPNSRDMVSQPYTVVSDRWVILKKTTRLYQDPTKYSESITDYVYDTDTHLQLLSSETKASDESILKTEFAYPPEASWIPVGMWQNKYMYANPVQKKTFKNGSLISIYKATYNNQGDIYLLSKEETAIASGPLETLNTYSYSPSFNMEQVNARNGIASSYIWDYENAFPIAKVINGGINDVAYTSFEADGKGGWTYIGNPVVDASAISGKKIYDLTGGSITKSITAPGIYTVSYWSKNGSKTINGTTTIAGRTVNGWIYYEHKGNFSAGIVTVSGSGFIDELRLYPVGAQMTTFAYEPLIGQTSMADPNGEITYYEYDSFNRLKNIKDYQSNIVKNFQYNYHNSCGDNCVVLPMQTVTGYNTPGYPVGVFSVDGQLLGNATNQAQYIGLWNANAVNQTIGVLSAGNDVLHFNLALIPGKTPPTGLTGLRYYQFDISYNQLDAIRNVNGAYVDFGDGTAMRLGKTESDANVTLASNTSVSLAGVDLPNNKPGIPYFIHTYPDNSLKTITIYHNDSYDYERFGLDNFNTPATSLTKVKNLQGILPQFITRIGSSSAQESSFTSIANISNWPGITSVKVWGGGNGDNINPSMNIGYSQDFMINNKDLETISTGGSGYYYSSYRDLNFKISRLKSDWTTYFTKLSTLSFNEDHWDHEDLSVIKNLKSFTLVATTTTHSDANPPGNPPIPLDVSVIDNAIIQIAAGAGQTVSNGRIVFTSGGSVRGVASNAAYDFLTSKGWTINFIF